MLARIAALVPAPGLGGSSALVPALPWRPTPADGGEEGRAGWVPARPTPGPDPVNVPGSEAGPSVPHAPDTPAAELPAGSLADLQSRALTSAMAAYTAAHGHTTTEALAGDGPRRWRLRARAAAVAACALLLLGGLVVARSMQQAQSVVLPAPTDPPTGAPGVVQPEVVVHVVGQVGQPGLVRLPEGSRVADAIDAAGGAGAEADLSGINLARVLVDGEQVVVPRPGEQATGAPSGGTSLLDLNSADAAALDGLPGVGPVLAQRIVEWRTEHGAFTVVDELAEVTGIGPAVLSGVRDLVRVG